MKKSNGTRIEDHPDHIGNAHETAAASGANTTRNDDDGNGESEEIDC